LGVRITMRTVAGRPYSPEFSTEKYSSAAQQYYPSGRVQVFPVYVCRNCNLRFQSKRPIEAGIKIKRPEVCPRCYSLLTHGIGSTTVER
jgi:hypothetical protein